MKRFILILLTLVMVSSFTLPAILAARVTSGSGPSASTKRKVDPNSLRELLTKGLKATRKDEEEYIDHVVSLVMKGKLPVALVYASFQYARKRRPDYPFPHFVYSLRSLAQRNKIEI
jgi:hypothetical protein